jgi:hypothetical protein
MGTTTTNRIIGKDVPTDVLRDDDGGNDAEVKNQPFGVLSTQVDV